ncbi:arsinothricin resistance N-acetyltransferase ArsN1 family B [Halomarina oriensis]|uniref:GNAT family N-acetyltransferase n=1 Tax=Halomarina oriensis TaxID=671145 RepID=A0A6B0GL37_9EURY|nr:arsinothricin resistance N-acetyltransferase ArsN1 family B [Halomarina oriensis]MWG34591.1 GNAT family N-acetyltransferase [Halomarina oriensis]
MPASADVRRRLASPDDAPAIRRIYAPFVEETAISFEGDPPSADELRERIDATLPQYPWLVAGTDAGVVGYAYAGPFQSRPAYRWSAECSVYVARDSHRSGVGRTLYTALFDLLARQNYRTVYAGMTVPNAASAGLHDSMGFAPVGTFERAGYKHGAWHDVQWWQRTLDGAEDDTSGPPDEPRALTELTERELDAALHDDSGN